MRVLVTGGDTLLGRAVAAALAGRHEVRSLDPTDGDPRDRAVAAAMTADRDAVVHLLPTASAATPQETLDRATRGTYNLLVAAPPGARFVLVSSLRPFERYPAAWRVTEQWAPRPTTDPLDLAFSLAEVTAREVGRARPRPTVLLRLAEVVPAAAVMDGARDPRWLHVEDATQAVLRALADFPAAEPPPAWRVFHIPGGGRHTRFPLALAARPPFAYAPRHDLAPASPPRPALDSGMDRGTRSWGATSSVLLPGSDPQVQGGGEAAGRRVVIFGAGGPLGAVTAAALAPDHHLRLTDLRPLAELAVGPPQSPGAPLPTPFGPPHETTVVDVADPVQVADAVRGVDAIVNCSVVRPHPVEAFRVNVLGAYNVAAAALTHGVRRIVHTGPIQTLLAYPAGYEADFHVSPDAPPRPGDNLYFLSKLLGQEICRVFAWEHGLEVPALLFGNFVDPALPVDDPDRFYPLTVSWADAGEAMRRAVLAPSFPRPFEVMHVNADLPHGQYPNDKAKRLLAWQPRDRLEGHWRRDDGGSPWGVGTAGGD